MIVLGVIVVVFVIVLGVQAAKGAAGEQHRKDVLN